MVRAEKLVGLAGTTTDVLSFLGGPGAAAVVKSIKAHVTVAKQFVDAQAACSALAACEQKQGVVGAMGITNALGRVMVSANGRPRGPVNIRHSRLAD